ncbi:glutaminase [Bacteroidia bacterium]|nr:glutaminase [Bacteroidia bacterium]
MNKMNKINRAWMILAVIVLAGCRQGIHVKTESIKNDLRAPAYPLVTIDPYTSAWSFADNLYDESVKHWTGTKFPFVGAIRVDGKVYRFMGTEETPLLPVAKTAEAGSWTGRYLRVKPSTGWEKPEFNDSRWQEGPAAFGTKEETAVQTLWEGDNTDIWVRREVILDEDLSGKKVFLEYSHDDSFELYVNGIEVVNTGYKWQKNVMLPLSGEALKTLKKGKNVIAAHCGNKTGGALVDFGLHIESPVNRYFETAAVQKSADVQATQTHYLFACGPVDLQLTFTAPLLMHNLELISRPVNYISYQVSPTDGQAHQVEIYFEASPAWALNKSKQESKSESFEKDGLVFLKTGSVSQDILKKRGDDVRIDWGYFYLCAEKANATYATGDESALRENFAVKGSSETTIAAVENEKLALSQTLGTVNKPVSGKIMIGYDDLYSIQYFGENLRPYWNNDGKRSIESVFAQANREYAKLKSDCDKFDYELITKTATVGGKEYAELCALAYRQSIAAHKLVEAPNGDLLFLSKENFSNGSIGTVDVTYPSAPLFLLYNPELAKGLLNHIFYFSESGKWTKPFAAHDVGTYPQANGQTYGGDMPVEENGNMLILTAAIAAMEGNAAYAEKHWVTLTTWTDYLVEKGLDPENQLCTDDFAGHFAHNANLSIKAILGIASYGRLAEMLGKKEIAEKYTAQARNMAAEWVKLADNGDHYRLTFDQPGTWSQKYNIVWDKLLKLDIFPKTIVEKEIPYYLTMQNDYGLPLDSRKTYTKSDWIVWTATLAKDKETFEQFIRPVHRFMNETTDRIPMSDWYFTDSRKHVGFQARSVVGGYFIKMLEEK